MSRIRSESAMQVLSSTGEEKYKRGLDRCEGHEGRGQTLNFKEVDRAKEAKREKAGCLPGT